MQVKESVVRYRQKRDLVLCIGVCLLFPAMVASFSIPGAVLWFGVATEMMLLRAVTDRPRRHRSTSTHSGHLRRHNRRIVDG